MVDSKSPFEFSEIQIQEVPDRLPFGRKVIEIQEKRCKGCGAILPRHYPPCKV